jgi:hypothetical protein
MKSGLLLRESRRVRIRYEARTFTINEYRLHTENSVVILHLRRHWPNGPKKRRISKAKGLWSLGVTN